MGDRDPEAGPVRDLLESVLPAVRPYTVGAAGICEDQEFARAGVHAPADAAPPRVNGVGGERGRVVGRADDDRPIAARHVVNAVRNRNAIGIAREVVNVDVDRRLAPRSSLVFERTDELPLLGIDADDRLPARRERFFQLLKLRELLLSIRRRLPR